MFNKLTLVLMAMAIMPIFCGKTDPKEKEDVEKFCKIFGCDITQKEGKDPKGNKVEFSECDKCPKAGECLKDKAKCPAEVLKDFPHFHPNQPKTRDELPATNLCCNLACGPVLCRIRVFGKPACLADLLC